MTGARRVEQIVTDEPNPAHLLRLSRAFCRALHWVAVVWSLVVIVLLALAQWLDLLAHRPGGAAFAIAERPVFMALFAVGVLLALKWEIVGGSIAAFTAAALVVFAGEQLKLGTAIVVVVAFAIPALMWVLIDLNDQPPRRALLGLVVAGTAVLSGGVVAEEIYDGLFGPSHPESEIEALPESPLDWVWSGAVTSTSFEVVAKVDDDADRVRLGVSARVDMIDAVFSSAVPRGDHGLVRLAIDGLEPGRQYFYAVEIDGAFDMVRAGTVATFPSAPSSFTVAVGSDARTGSNGSVYDTIREIAPLLFLVPGDFHYGDVEEDDRGQFEDVLDLTLSRPAQAALYRSVPVAYVWDDHDFAGNDSGPEVESAPIALESYLRYVPHYPLGGPGPAIHQAFSIGRVRFIMTDGRSARSAASAPDDAAKSMLGSAQKQWFKDELLRSVATHELIVWVNPQPWIGPAQLGGDDWSGYTTERQEIADFIADNGIDSLMMVSGDAHMLAIDDGTNSDYSTAGIGGFPVVHAAALDRPGSVKGGPFSEGTFPGSGQFALLTFSDEGRSVSVEISGRNHLDEEIVSYRFGP